MPSSRSPRCSARTKSSAGSRLPAPDTAERMRSMGPSGPQRQDSSAPHYERSRLPSNGWAPVPVALYRDPRYRRLSLRAARLHTDAHLFANDLETDGVVTRDDVLMLGAAAHFNQVHIAACLTELTRSGFWRKDGANYTLLDFLGVDHIERDLRRKEWRELKE